VISSNSLVAGKVSGDRGPGSYDGVSSLTMALMVVLVVKAGLLCIALVAILHRYIHRRQIENLLPACRNRMASLLTNAIY
jgi:hypothetical protein